jgi:lysophospholipid acyltransferase (LPLAT)-like uncharacterized protein
MGIFQRLTVWVIRALCFTWRVRWVDVAERDVALKSGPVVYAFLHGEQLAMIATHSLHMRESGQKIYGIASKSKDGDFIAGVMAALGYGLVRGSSSKGGGEAMRQSEEALAYGHSVGVTVDGPRGPRGVSKVGAAVIAHRGGVPLVWVKARSSFRWRLGSWDRFEIPLPFSKVSIYSGIIVNERLDEALGRLELELTNEGRV